MNTRNYHVIYEFPLRFQVLCNALPENTDCVTLAVQTFQQTFQQKLQQKIQLKFLHCEWPTSEYTMSSETKNFPRIKFKKNFFLNAKIDCTFEVFTSWKKQKHEEFHEVITNQNFILMRFYLHVHEDWPSKNTLGKNKLNPSHFLFLIHSLFSIRSERGKLFMESFQLHF